MAPLRPPRDRPPQLPRERAPEVRVLVLPYPGVHRAPLRLAQRPRQPVDERLARREEDEVVRGVERGGVPNERNRCVKTIQTTLTKKS